MREERSEAELHHHPGQHGGAVPTPVKLLSPVPAPRSASHTQHQVCYGGILFSFLSGPAVTPGALLISWAAARAAPPSGSCVAEGHRHGPLILITARTNLSFIRDTSLPAPRASAHGSPSHTSQLGTGSFVKSAPKIAFFQGDFPSRATAGGTGHPGRAGHSLARRVHLGRVEEVDAALVGDGHQLLGHLRAGTRGWARALLAAPAAPVLGVSPLIGAGSGTGAAVPSCTGFIPRILPSDPSWEELISSQREVLRLLTGKQPTI